MLRLSENNIFYNHSMNISNTFKESTIVLTIFIENLEFASDPYTPGILINIIFRALKLI